MIKVLYYIPNMDRSYGGIYQYAFALLKKISQDLEDKCMFYVYLLKESEDYEQLSKERKNIVLFSEPVAEPKEIQNQRTTIELKNKFLRRLSPKNVIPNPLPNIPLDYLLQKNKIDLVHCPFIDVPENSLNIPRITTMHDVQELHFPQFFDSGQRAKRAVNNKKAVDNASQVIVSYQHIKNDIVKFFEKDSSEIHVCLLEMSHLWFSKYQSEENQKHSTKDYGEYILCPAATWEHKNHIKLLEAIKYLKEKLNYKINLICTGSKQKHYYDTIEPYLDKVNLKEQVKFMGVVDDKVLFELYQKAKAIVIPTLYEAGSFPLMESILMQLPVICSNVTSLPETIKNEKFVFNPHDEKDIAGKIKEITSNKQFVKENIENSKEVSKYLLNTDIAKKIYHIYELCLAKK